MMMVGRTAPILLARAVLLESGALSLRNRDCYVQGLSSERLNMDKGTQKVRPLTGDERTIFEVAFRTCGTSRMRCACGTFFYNSSGQWDWEEGELEEYHADKQAIDVDYTIGRLGFNGSEYADACDCWIGDAARIYRWLVNSRYSVCDFYTGYKKAALAEANALPTATI